MARSSSLARRLRRLALYALAGLACLYLAGASAGYYWIHYSRKNTAVTFLQVALLQQAKIRRGVAVQQFATAKREWDAKNFQAAYLAFVSAVRNDPDNIPGRLSAAEMLGEAGAGAMALLMLEDGLARAPDNQQLLERTYDLLTGTGRDQRALELLHRLPAASFAGPNGPMLRTYELTATLNADGAAAAKGLLALHPEVEKFPGSVPVVSRILWESRERLKAIELLTGFVRTQSKNFLLFAQLARWQVASGLASEALATVELAGGKFAGDPRVALLRIEVLAEKTGRGREWQQAVTDYLAAHGRTPSGLNQLAQLAGLGGWLDLSRALYETGAIHQSDLGVLALCYADALAANQRAADARRVLAQLEAQGPENASLLVLLRQRQVLLASAQGDPNTVREAARSLGSLLRNAPEQLELARRRFAGLGLAEAAEELAGTAPATKTATAR